MALRHEKQSRNKCFGSFLKGFEIAKKLFGNFLVQLTPVNLNNDGQTL